MSAWMGQARAKMPSRLPRIADYAVERARLTVVPRRQAPAPRMPFMILVALVLLGGVVGLLLFNTSMQQASFAASHLEDQAATLAAREQTLRMELDSSSGGGANAARMPSANRVRAAWRFWRWDRCSDASIVITPSTRRDARAATTRPRCASVSAAEVAGDQDSCTRESVVLTP